MKKIFILLFLIGALTFINIELFASTYHSYDLDTNLQELGGVSIREFFEDYNLVQNHDFSNGLNYWSLSGFDAGNYSIVNNEINFIGNNTLTYPYISQTNIFNTNDYYFVYLELKTNTYATHKIESGTADFTRINIQANSYTKLSYIRQSTTAYTNLVIQVITSGINFSTNETMTIDIDQGIYVINLTSLGVQQTIYQLEYFMKIYQTLKKQENSYNDGETDGLITGYNDGYSTGYDDGNLDGYSAGYDDGLFDYHTGNYYGAFDYTLSDAYNQATQANVSLLNIVSLIIGVVMSMIGFIINIDIFGISIASVLGTLAIGVGIIWLLKLIRG